MYKDEKSVIKFEIKKMMLLTSILLREHFVKTKLNDIEQKYFFKVNYQETNLIFNMIQNYLYELYKKI